MALAKELKVAKSIVPSASTSTQKGAETVSAGGKRKPAFTQSQGKKSKRAKRQTKPPPAPPTTVTSIPKDGKGKD